MSPRARCERMHTLGDRSRYRDFGTAEIFDSIRFVGWGGNGCPASQHHSIPPLYPWGERIQHSQPSRLATIYFKEMGISHGEHLRSGKSGVSRRLFVLLSTPYSERRERTSFHDFKKKGLSQVHMRLMGRSHRYQAISCFAPSISKLLAALMAGS